MTSEDIQARASQQLATGLSQMAAERDRIEGVDDSEIVTLTFTRSELRVEAAAHREYWQSGAWPLDGSSNVDRGISFRLHSRAARALRKMGEQA